MEYQCAGLRTHIAAGSAAALQSMTFPVDADCELPAGASTPDFVWRSGRVRLTSWGTAAEVTVTGKHHLSHAATASMDILRSIRTDSSARTARPLVVGALSFCGRTASRLVVPAYVLRRVEGEERSWLTVVSPVVTARSRPTGGSRRPTVHTGTRPARQEYQRWRSAVRTVLREIEAGTVAKALVTRQALIDTDREWHLSEVFRRFEERFPTSYVYGARLSGGDLFAGAIPELLVSRDGALVASHPLAGTAPLGTTDDARRAAHRYLTTSPKIDLEHQLVVDDIVRRLAYLGADVSAHLPAIVELPTLLHLGTRVTADFPGSAPNALALVAALHPTPAVGGVPQQAALALINRLEPSARGYYAGPVGWMDSAGDGEWTLGLRSATITGRRVRLCAGAGIVADSDPHDEWLETAGKLASISHVFSRSR